MILQLFCLAPGLVFGRFWPPNLKDFGGARGSERERERHLGPWLLLGLSWCHLGAILALSWAILGLSWATLGRLVAVLWPFCDNLDGLVALFGHLRAILSCPGPACGHLGPILEPCWCNSGANLGAFRKFRKRLQATCQQGSRYKLKVPTPCQQGCRNKLEVTTTHLKTRRVLRCGVLFGNTCSETLFRKRFLRYLLSLTWGFAQCRLTKTNLALCM